MLTKQNERFLIYTVIVISLILPVGVLSQSLDFLQIPSQGSIHYSTFSPLNPPIPPPLPDTYDYIVYKVDAQYFCKNSTGAIEYSGPNAREVIQFAIDASSGKGIFVENAEYEINGTLLMKTDVTLVLENGVVFNETGFDKWIMYFNNVQNAYLTSTGKAKIFGTGSGGAEKGIVLRFSNNNTISNIEITHTAEELIDHSRSHFNLYENITGYEYSLGMYESHGILIDSSRFNYLINCVVDAKFAGQSRTGLLLVGNYEECSYNVVLGGEFKNSKRDNGIYLIGYAYPVKNNYLSGFIVSGNKREGHAGLKLRASSYNTIIDFQSFDNHNGIEVGTDMTGENGIEPNSVGNYIQGVVRDNENIGLILYIDQEGRTVANNNFELVLDNNKGGIWGNVGFDNGIIENNKFNISSINGIHGIIFDIVIPSGYIRYNYFKGIIKNNIEYGIRTQGPYSPQEYGINFIGNRFDAVIENNSGGSVLDSGIRTSINKVGQETAGINGTPNVSFWEVGDVVINTDDNTIWIKETDEMKPFSQLMARFMYITDSAGINSTTAQFIDQSFDPNSTIIAWNWDFGDGTTSIQKNPTHNYPSSGTYTVTLTVVNEYNDSAMITKSVSIGG